MIILNFLYNVHDMEIIMIPKDKQLHFIAGLIIGILGGVIIDPITGIGKCL